MKVSLVGLFGLDLLPSCPILDWMFILSSFFFCHSCIGIARHPHTSVADPGFPKRKREPAAEFGSTTYYLARFYWKMHENEIDSKGGRSLRPLGSANLLALSEGYFVSLVGSVMQMGLNLNWLSANVGHAASVLWISSTIFKRILLAILRRREHPLFWRHQIRFSKIRWIFHGLCGNGIVYLFGL